MCFFYYRLPCKENIKKAWIDFIKIKKGLSWQEKKSVFICKLHFDTSSYRIPVVSNPDKIYLKPDAIPSILAIDSNIEKKQHSEEQATSSNFDTEYIIGKKQ